MEHNYTDRFTKKSYTVITYPEDNTRMTVICDGKEKTAKIVDVHGFIYVLKKTQVNARDGARGLIRFFDEATTEQIMECLVFKVLDYIIDEIKPARA